MRLVLRLQAPHPPRLRMGLRPAHTEAGYHFRGAWALQCSCGAGVFRKATNPPLGPGALGCALATAPYGVPGIFPPVHIRHSGAIYKFLPSAVKAIGQGKEEKLRPKKTRDAGTSRVARATPGPQSPHGHSGAVTFPRLLPEWPQGHLGRSHRQVACPPRWPRGHLGGGHLASKSPAGHSEKSDR